MKLLLAEDERELSQAIVKILECNKYDVDAVYDGEAALEKTEENDYDGAVIDIMMPKTDGITVVKKLREKGNNLPVLLLTAKSEIEDKVTGLDAGADDYLTKPFAVKELLARIRALLRRKAEFKECYKIGNVTLDSDTFEMKAETIVKLTSTEFKLMQYLIRNHARYVSAEMLMDNVWEFESDVEINVVWVFLSMLRKKLDKTGADYTIISERGRGYRLESKK